ncbi:VOC family protein [Cellulomonas marina]|uniref:PhnB protein n=1 Tax=Cellulomonas marina TaxID=988821 RepID=A0A1I1AHG7_9CELL|nr:VOC family protein [Cellulomonas marina]GIG30777.1 VOC family protein [Cellulomonas marina]SFB37455.1 PhnB protein [Cellulomonas marina]
MTTELAPYLSFRDQARACLEFYASVLGGEATFSTFGEFGMSQDAAERDLVMHGQLVTARGLKIMAADTPSTMEVTAPGGFSMSLFGGPEDEAEMRGFFEGLLEGGTQTVPLEKAPWGDTFGMLVDRFGVPWMVNIGGAPDEG